MAKPTEANIFCAPERVALDGDDLPLQVVNLERTGNMGSSLAMSTNGQLILATGGANLDECQCENKERA